MKAARSFETSERTDPPTKLDYPRSPDSFRNLVTEFSHYASTKTVDKYQLENQSLRYTVGAASN